MRILETDPVEMVTGFARSLLQGWRVGTGRNKERVVLQSEPAQKPQQLLLLILRDAKAVHTPSKRQHQQLTAPTTCCRIVPFYHSGALHTCRYTHKKEVFSVIQQQY